MAMAADTNSGGEGEVTCPQCEDYEGAPSSVEAHISRNTDADHKGMVGNMVRDEIYKRAGLTDGDGDDGDSGPLQSPSVEDGGESSVDSTEDSSVESSDVSDVEGGGESSVDSTEDSSVDVEVETTERSVEDAPETADSAGFGIPVPVSSTTLMVGAAAFLVFALWRASRSSSSSSGAPDQGGQEDDDQDAVSNEEVTLFE